MQATQADPASAPHTLGGALISKSQLVTQRIPPVPGAYFNSYREFDEWWQYSRSFGKLTAVTWATGPRSMLWQGKPVDLVAIPASVDFFSMLGKHAAMGRTFAESDFGSPCTPCACCEMSGSSYFPHIGMAGPVGESESSDGLGVVE